METVKAVVTLTFVEELLGTASANPEIFTEYQQDQVPDEARAVEEQETLPDVEENIAKSTTVFHRDEDGTPFLYDYLVKGFFKDAAGMLRRAPKTLSKDRKAFRKEIDGLIFVAPRRLRLILPDGAKVGICERPLRAQTMQGERVALARSERVPAGTTLTFEIVMFLNLEDEVREWLDYGAFRGMGQWRNSGKGRFSYTWKGIDRTCAKELPFAAPRRSAVPRKGGALLSRAKPRLRIA